MAGQLSTLGSVVVVKSTLSEAASNLGTQALERFNAADWSSAIELARLQVAVPSCAGPVKAEMHHIEAACLYQLGDLKHAENAIRSAVLLEPTKVNYLNTYGVILRKNNRMSMPFVHTSWSLRYYRFC